MTIRPAEPADIVPLAHLWHDGWQDAHAAILPAELKRRRTLESFVQRLKAGLGDVRVGGPVGAPTGFCMIKGDELYQLYVAAEARGTGLARALVANAEARLTASGVTTAFLSCAIGNDRAARFYEKCGWRRLGTMISKLDTPQGLFELETWRYEKALPAGLVS